ncbi:hypothetical protein GNI_139610 [Gregarina niphandrodes]|uniref:Uncharacterized protein n=1 Tax=Gregarina niphandrodes TaxID=110365 RepID=A0A023B0F5_GRENI|nr:hypothetical protein GNI_139610 [Gregarina niphandrodes]EZG45315.1 hypothetical protein GNI_139610 [Gregarina niphandrodes]|eukprot:XP_011132530.1 hypothetical protein GNI_139610 [Gregarina niphandrodes]
MKCSLPDHGRRDGCMAALAEVIWPVCVDGYWINGVDVCDLLSERTSPTRAALVSALGLLKSLPDTALVLCATELETDRRDRAFVTRAWAQLLDESPLLETCLLVSVADFLRQEALTADHRLTSRKPRQRAAFERDVAHWVRRFGSVVHAARATPGATALRVPQCLKNRLDDLSPDKPADRSKLQRWTRKKRQKVIGEEEKAEPKNLEDLTARYWKRVLINDCGHFVQLPTAATPQRATYAVSRRRVATHIADDHHDDTHTHLLSAERLFWNGE